MNTQDEPKNITKDAVAVIAAAAHLPAEHPVHLVCKDGRTGEETATLLAALEKDGLRIERAVRKALPNRRAQRVLEVFHAALLEQFVWGLMDVEGSSADLEQDELGEDQKRGVFFDEANILVIHPGFGSSPGSCQSGVSPGSAASSASSPSPPAGRSSGSRQSGTSPRSAASSASFPSSPTGRSSGSSMSSISPNSPPSVLGILAVVSGR